MKINIHKFQQGGGFAQFTPILRSLADQQPQRSTESSTSNKQSSSLLDDDIYKELIKSGGLVNDVNAFVNELSKLESDPLSFSNSGNSTRALQLFAKINELKENKEIWDESVSIAKESGGLGEIAINSYGEIYSRNEDGKLSTIHVSEYKKNKDKYNPLTVSELLNARQFEPQLTFNQSIFTVAQNSIGIEKINSHLKSIISAFGSQSVQTERHYTKQQISEEIARIKGLDKPSNQELQSLEMLYQLSNTPGEFFKVVEKDSGKKKQLQTGLNYLISILPKEYQLKLEATAIQNGRSGAADYIVDMLTLFTPQEEVSEITPTKGPGGTDASATGDKNLTRFQLFHKDKMMGAYPMFSFNDPDLDVMFQGTIGAVGPLVDKKDNNVGMTTLADILFNKEYNAVVNSNQIYFGDKPVNMENINNVVYDGKDAAKVYMPVGRDGSPDFEAHQKFKEIYTVYEANKNNWTVKQAQDFFKENGYNLQIREHFDGTKNEKIILDNPWVKPFLVLHGYTNSATGLTEDNNFIKKLSLGEEDAILPYLEQIWTIGSGKSTKSVVPEKSFHWEKYYKGVITIPYKRDSAAIVDTMVGQGPKERPSTITDVQRNIQYSSNIPIVQTDARVLTQ